MATARAGVSMRRVYLALGAAMQNCLGRSFALVAGLWLLGACPGGAARDRGSDDVSDDDGGGTPVGETDAAAPRSPDAARPAPATNMDAPATGADAAGIVGDAGKPSDPGGPDAGPSPPDARPTDAKPATDAPKAGYLSPGPNGEILWIDMNTNLDRVTLKTGVKGDPVANWKQPVDYFDGTIQVRASVLKNDPPAAEWVELIFWAPDGKHACMNCTRPDDLAKPGDYTCSVTPKGGGGWFCYGPGALDWPKSLEVQISGGRTDNGTRTPSPNLPKLPGHVLNIHYTAVLVPAGKKFSGWQNYPKP